MSDRPSGAGAAAAAAAGEWPLAGDGAAGCAVADADADTARSVSPSRGRGPPWARHGGPPGRTRAPHLRQSARRWRRARRLVEWHAVVARVRAPPRRVWRRCYPSPLPPRPLIPPPPPPRSARGNESVSGPPLALPPSPPSSRLLAQPHGGDGGAGHGTRRVGWRAVLLTAGGWLAVSCSAIDLVQRIRIRQRVVSPYPDVEACSRPVGNCLIRQGRASSGHVYDPAPIDLFLE